MPRIRRVQHDDIKYKNRAQRRLWPLIKDGKDVPKDEVLHVLGPALARHFDVMADGNEFHITQKPVPNKAKRRGYRKKTDETAQATTALEPIVRVPKRELTISEHTLRAEVFASLEDFEDKATASKMLGELGIKDGNIAVAMAICRAMFKIQDKGPISLSIIDNTGQDGLERKEVEIATIKAERFMILRITIDGVYKPSSFLALKPESIDGYNVPFIDFNDLRDGMLSRLNELLLVAASYYVARMNDRGSSIIPLPDWVSLRPVRYFKKPDNMAVEATVGN